MDELRELMRLIELIKKFGLQFAQKQINIYEYQKLMESAYNGLKQEVKFAGDRLDNRIFMVGERNYQAGLKKCQSTATMPVNRYGSSLSDKSMFPLSDEQKALYDIVESVRTIKRKVNDASQYGVEYVPLTSINGVVDAVGDYATDVLLESKNNYIDSLNNIGNTLNPFSF